MKAEMQQQAEQYIRIGKKRRKRGRVVAGLSVLVALLTTYVLMLPGITMEQNMLCGLEQHLHTAECYTSQLNCGQEEREAFTEETVSMVCTFQPHTHNDECYNVGDDEPDCGRTEDYFHTHDDLCYNNEGTLICSLKENPKHKHTAECYKEVSVITCQTAESAGHQHEESCYTSVAAQQPACGLEETQGHTHTENCTAAVLVCSVEENAGHVHTAECIAHETHLTCTENEIAAHAHGDSCYTSETALTCTLAESEGEDGHAHGEGCYSTTVTLTCTQAETAGHTHGDACYTTTENIICGKAEGEGAHAHTEDCYTQETICGLAEGEGAHSHTAECYPTEKVLSCGLTEGEGAHTHGEGCSMVVKNLICTILHEHDENCRQTDANGKSWIVCGLVEMREHQHSDSCVTVTINSDTGHAHTDECYVDVLVCTTAEHEHVAACYPDATAEPTAEPTVEPTVESTVEPTAEPTVEATVDPTVEPVETPATATDITAEPVVTAEPTEEPAATEEPTVAPVEDNIAEPTAVPATETDLETAPEKTEQPEEIPATSTDVEPDKAAEPTAVPTEEPTTKSEEATQTDLESVLDEAGLISTATDLSQQGTAANDEVGLMMSVAPRDTSELSDGVSFGQFVTSVNVHSGSSTEYDPDTGKYDTSLDINFKIPSETSSSGVTHFVYELPESVGVSSESIYNETFSIMDATGTKVVGTFKIVKGSDNKHYLDIYFEDTAFSTGSDCYGTLYFQCSIDGSATDDNGDINIRFEDEAGLVIDGDDIIRDEQETANYSLYTEKKNAGVNGNAFDGNSKLIYQISVKSKGTPDVINLTDTLNVSGVSVENIQITSVTYTANGSTSSVPSSTENNNGFYYTATSNGNNMNITLPKVANVNSGTEAEYLITYEVQLQDIGYQNVYLNAQNQINAVSGAGTSNEVSDNDYVQESLNQKILNKSGYYDSSSDTIKWTVVFNESNKNIGGMTLTDEMLATLSNTSEVKIEPNSNYTILTDSQNKITGIQFNGDQNNPNTTKYTITYETKPSQDYAPNNYVEQNKVALKDPNGDTVVEDKYDVGNINRNQNVDKQLLSSTEDDENKKVTMEWKVSIDVDSDGLSNDVYVTDNMSPDGVHYMTFDQLKTFYEQQLSGIVAKNDDNTPNMTVNVVTVSENGTVSQETKTISEVLNGSYNNAMFDSFKFLLDAESQTVSQIRNGTIDLTYSSTADTSTLTSNTQFRNSVNVGENGGKSDTDFVDYVADSQNPVTKYCGEQNHNNNGECSWEHQNSTTNPFNWGISVFQNEQYQQLRIVDTLPEGVEPTDIYLGYNLQTKLTYDANAQQDGQGYVPLTLTPANDTTGLSISGRYNPQTRQIEIIVKEDDDSSTTVDSNQWGEKKTFRLKVCAYPTADNLPASGETKQYSVKNTVNVFVTENYQEKEYDSDEYTYLGKITADKLILKKDMNYQENDSYINQYHKDRFGWIVDVNQPVEYDELIIKDTLPEGLILEKVLIGSSMINVAYNQDGSMVLDTTIGSSETGLSIIPSYDASSRNFQIRIALDNDEATTNNPQSSHFGEGQKLEVKYYFSIPEESLPNEETTEVTLKYTNTVSVDMVKNNETTTGTDDQTQNLNLKYSKPVIKMDGSGNANDTVVNSNNGQLQWKIKIEQPEQYEYLRIEEQLPSGVVELDARGQSGTVLWFENTMYGFVLGEKENESDVTVPVKAVNVYYMEGGVPFPNEVVGTYNLETGKIVIELPYVANQSNSFDNGRPLVTQGRTEYLVVYAKVKEEYQPDTEDGQYIKELGYLTNNVTVTTDKGELGHDDQSQNVTITKEKPNFTAVDKMQPIYDGDTRILHYTVDINPEQMDMDPASGLLTVVDKVTYSQNTPNKYYYTETDIQGNTVQKEITYEPGRKLTLIGDSVKLYFADYDENGTPLTDAQGNLVPGDPVDPSKWTMKYEEDDSQDTAIRTITLEVPDERALVLVYDYSVSMKEVPGKDADKLKDQIQIAVRNTATVKGYEQKQSSSETGSTDTWVVTAGGGMVANTGFQLIKHDNANQALVLTGVTFEVSRYNKDTNTWEKINDYTTDDEGKISLRAIAGDDTFKKDVLYRIVETQSIIGYEAVSDNPPTFYFALGGAKIDEIANAAGISKDLVYNGEKSLQTVYVGNQKRDTSLKVEKVWKNPDGSLMAGRDMPASVTVDLHRYAIPVDTWEAMVAETGGKINGALLEGQTKTNVTITVSNSPNYTWTPANNRIVQLEAFVGRKLEFDVVVNESWVYYYPDFTDGLEYVSMTQDGNKSYYHYIVDSVTENMELLAYFRRLSDDDFWWNDNIKQYVSIENIQVEDAAREDHSEYTAMLQPYDDRSYSLPMKLTSASDWKATWENLDLEGEIVNADGSTTRIHYKYYVTETAPSGYSATITGYSSDDGGKFVVENRKDGSYTEKTNIRVYKKWYDNQGREFTYNKETGTWTAPDGNVYAYENSTWYTVSNGERTEVTDSNTLATLPLPSVSLRLLRKDLMAGEDAAWQNYIYNGNSQTVINNGTNWMYNFVDLPTAVYDSKGRIVENYDYFIEEINQGDFAVELVKSGTETDNGRKYEVITVKNAAIRNIDVSVEKRWAEEVMPLSSLQSVTVVLNRMIYTENGYELDESFGHDNQTVDLSTDNNWKYTWNDLPNGEAATENSPMKSYSYVVTETHVNGVPIEDTLYEVTTSYGSDGTIILTNTRVLPKTAIGVEKIWNDVEGNEIAAPDGASVTLKLMRKPGADGSEAQEMQTVVLNAGNKWYTNITELEKYVLGDNGEPTTTEYVYYFVEENVPDGFKVQYSNYADGSFTAAADGWITVTNRAVTDMTITKQWKNLLDNNVTPTATEVYFKLLKDGVEYPVTQESNGVQVQDGYIVVSAANSWTVSISNLPDTNEDGSQPVYSLQEYVKSGSEYVPFNSAQYSPASGNESTAFEVVNYVVDVSLEKLWRNADTSPATLPEGTTATFKLMRKVNGGEPEEVTTVTLNGSENPAWRMTIDDVPARDADGKDYSYYFEELNVPEGFVATYSSGFDGSTHTNIVANTRHNSLTLEKTWEDANHGQTEATFDIYRRAKWIGPAEDDPTQVTDVSITFEIWVRNSGWAKMESVTQTFKSNEYIIWKPTYMHDEWWGYHPSGSVANQIRTHSGRYIPFAEATADGNGPVAYTYSFEIGYAGNGGTVRWDVENWYWGNQGEAGSADYDNWSHAFETSTPAGDTNVVDEKVATVTLTAADGWTKTFESEDWLLLDNELYAYEYFVVETAPTGFNYTQVYSSNDAERLITVNNERSAVIVDTFTELSFSKVWENAADYKPDSISFTLEQTDSITSTTVDHTVTVDLTGQTPVASCQTLPGAEFTFVEAAEGIDGWTLTISNLIDTRTTDGVLTYDFSYAVTEEQATAGFDSAWNESTSTFTNTRTTTSATVVKTWAEGSPEDKPEVTMTLYRTMEKDGQRLDEIVALNGVTNPITLNGNENPAWSHTWTDLPTHGKITQNGTTISGQYTYYVVETPVDGYVASSNPADGSIGTDGKVTFTNTPTTLNVQKVWSGFADGEVNGYSVILQLKDSQGNAVDPTKYSSKTIVAVDGMDNCFEVAYNETVSFMGLPAGNYTLTEVAYRVGADGEIQVITNRDELPWTITGEDAAVELSNDTTEAKTATVTNTKRTQLTVEKKWSDGANEIAAPEGASITFELWRSTVLPDTETETASDVSAVSDEMATVNFNARGGGNDSYSHWKDVEYKVGSTVTIVLTYTSDPTYITEERSAQMCLLNNSAMSFLGRKQIDGSSSYALTYQFEVVSGTNFVEITAESAYSWESGSTYCIITVSADEVSDNTSETNGELLGTYTLSGDKWSERIADLPAADESGNEYFYFVREVEYAGFVTTYENNGAANDGYITIVNTKDEPDVVVETKTALNISKTWEGADDYKPDSISFTVTQTDSMAAEGTEPTVHTVTVDLTGDTPAASSDTLTALGATMTVTEATDGWTLNIADLPETRTVNGTTIYSYTYTVTENPVDGFESIPAENNGNGTFAFTNKRITKSITVVKSWADDGLQTNPPVTMTLYRRLVSGDITLEEPVPDTVATNPITLKGEEMPEWTGSWANLPTHGSITAADGTETTLTGEYIYYVVETALPGYVTTYAPENGVAGEDNQVTVTNTHTTLTISKVWDGYTNAADYSNYYVYLQVKDANGAVVDPALHGLMAYDVTVNGTTYADCVRINTESVTFKALPTGNYTVTEVAYQRGENGTLYPVIGETNLPWTVTNATAEMPDTAGTDPNANFNQTATVINTRRTELKVEKEWNTTAAESITFQLYKVVGDAVVATPSPTPTDAPEATPTPTPTEEPEATPEPTATATPSPTHASTKITVDFEMLKENNGGYVPMLARCYEDGTDVYATGQITVDSGSYVRVVLVWNNKWHAPSLSGLTFSNGNSTKCEITSSEDANGSNVTYIIDLGQVTESGKITWVIDKWCQAGRKNDGSIESTYWIIELEEYDPTTPTTLSLRSSTRSGSTAVLPSNAVAVENGTYTITAADGWEKAIYGLPFTEDGKAVTYYAVETTTGYVVTYTGNGATDGDTITITNSAPTVTTVSLQVSKQWLDPDGKEEIPTTYTVSYALYAEGGTEPVATGTLSNDNSWQATHTGLDPNTAYYIVETGVTNGNSEMSALYTTTYTVGDNTAQNQSPTVTGGGTVTIVNQRKPSYVLPETGGEGTQQYTGVGVVLIGIALTLLYKGNKRKRRADA